MFHGKKHPKDIEESEHETKMLENPNYQVFALGLISVILIFITEYTNLYLYSEMYIDRLLGI